MRLVAYDMYALEAVKGCKIKKVILGGSLYEGYTTIIKLDNGLELRVESDSEPRFLLYERGGDCD